MAINVAGLTALIDTLVESVASETERSEHSADPVAVKQWHRGRLSAMTTIQALVSQLDA
jgi:hypothetical protein